MRQLLVWFTALAVWFGAIGQGYYLLGPGGVLMFGGLFGIAIFMCAKMALRWKSWSLAERCMCLTAISLSVAAAAFLIDNHYKRGLHRDPENQRLAQRVQAELRRDSRFRSVTLSYEMWGMNRGSHYRLFVRGTVGDVQAERDLHRIIEKHDWSVDWEIRIDPAQ